MAVKKRRTNPYELVITASKDLETTLEKHWGAKGKGLHEKLSSVEQHIPHMLCKKIRRLATIRNKVVHDNAYTLRHSSQYEQEYLRVKQALVAVASERAGTNKPKAVSRANNTPLKRRHKSSAQRGPRAHRADFPRKQRPTRRAKKPVRRRGRLWGLGVLLLIACVALPLVGWLYLDWPIPRFFQPLLNRWV